MPQKVIFMGSPAFAVPSLQAVAANFEVVCVYSQPPRPAGRGQKLQKTAVHEAADLLGLDVRTPERLRGDALDELLKIEADALVVVAYGLLLPAAVVESRICLNVHPSALPRWRGAAPVQWTLLAGETSTDVCLMRLDSGMDTGPVYLRQRVEIDNKVTAGELLAETSRIGAELVVNGLRQLNTLEAVPQVGDATHARKLDAADRVINWVRPAREIYNQIRALSPLPAATFGFGDERVKILSGLEYGFGSRDKNVLAGTVLSMGPDGVDVACGDGQVLRLLTVQRPGKKALPVGETLQGWDLAIGSLLT